MTMHAPAPHTPVLRMEEAIGLGVALLAHVGLAAVLLLQPPKRIPPPVSERMTVSLAEDVGLTDTSPDPAAESQASVAPTLADVPSPPEPAVELQPAPRPSPRVTTPPPQPRPTARPTPRPSPVARATPTPRPSPRATATSAPRPRATATPAPRTTPSPRPTSGGSRIGNDFLEGSGSAQTTTRAAPAATFGPAEQASLRQAISRQLRPHWAAPQGPDAELLVTVLSWELNEDGSLAGRPKVVSQSGINDTNRAQAGRHAEQAIRAVQLAAPFDLPPQFYNGWKRIREWSFDRRLAQ
jgi:periplasmic protein TonB